MAVQLVGVGLYSPPEAARLLRITSSRLRRWIRGYTYWSHDLIADSRRSRPPVLRQTDVPVMRGRYALSFLELMEIRVVRELVDDHNIPLQTVRRVAAIARQVFGTRYPFASRTIFTEGRRVFASPLPGFGVNEVIELREGRTVQVHLARLYEPLAKEVVFDPKSTLARQWWPLGKAVPIVLDPHILFGAPTVAGTRVRSSSASEMAILGTAREAAEAFDLSLYQVEAAIRFERLLTAA